MSATPILDLEQEPPKARRRWAVYVFGIPITLAVMLVPLLASIVSENAPPFNGLLLLPALYFCIVVHELGHLSAGKLAGMDAGGLSVGGFMMVRSGERWVYRFDGSRCLLGGFAISFPPTREFGRSKFAWLVAGGPIASILLMAACWCALVNFGAGEWQWISSLFWAATMLLAPSLIPYSSQGVKSDGARLLQLWRDPDSARQLGAVASLQADEMKGVRPRDWDADLMARVMQTRSSESYYPYVQLLAAYRSSDGGNEEASVTFLENGLAAAFRSGSKALQKLFFLCAASASAEARNNPTQARIWLDRARKAAGGTKLEGAEGVEADIAIAEGRYADALGLLTKQRDLLVRKRVDSGIARFAHDRIAERESKCREALDNAPTNPAVTIAPPSTNSVEARTEASRARQKEAFPWISVAIIVILGGIALIAITFK